MKKMALFAIPLLFVLVSFYRADNYLVTGAIYDDKSQPIPYASVMEKNTRNGTMADSVGHFTLIVKTQTAVLILSAAGYISKEIKVEGKPITTKL